MLNLFFIYLLINIKLLGVASNLINSETTDTITTTTDSTRNAVLRPYRHHYHHHLVTSSPETTSTQTRARPRAGQRSPLAPRRPGPLSSPAETFCVPRIVCVITFSELLLVGLIGTGDGLNFLMG